MNNSVENMVVYYCCVSKGNRILYAYNGTTTSSSTSGGGGVGDPDSDPDPDIEKLATLCLQTTPPYHTWYFQTTGKMTFGFLIDDGYVYFAIVDEGLGNSAVVLQFLQHVRFEFNKVSNHNNTISSKGSILSAATPCSSGCLQEELVPVIRRLISSLENVSHDAYGNGMIPHSNHPRPFPSPSPECNLNGQIEVLSSTKAPLLGKPGKQDKKKMKDRLVSEIRDSSLEDHRRSTDRGIKIDVSNTESNGQGGSVMSAISLHKGSSSMRIRTSPQYARRMWWRKVRIVLAIDAIVCVLLFGIWLGICHGFRCISE